MLSSSLSLYKTQSTNCYKRSVLIVSNFLGWCLITARDGFFNLNVIKTAYDLLCINKIYLKIQGFGYRFVSIRTRNILEVKANTTNKGLIVLGLNQKLKYTHKRGVQIFSRNTTVMKLNFSYYFFLFKVFKYKKLGVYVKGTLFHLKLPKKKRKK